MRCSRVDCTVEETGVCLLNNDPSECPERLDESGLEADAPVGTNGMAQFPGSWAWTLLDARDLMRRRYVRVVAILGEPNAGKTACLASLYLLVARDRLTDFSFADSRTLRGFEEISQGARRWNQGAIPDQMTVHTELSDDRTPGFLHVRLVRRGSSTATDFLLSDLPGEWTSDLINENRVDRFEFAKRADAIWLVVDGSALEDVQRRQVTIHRTKLLLERLGALLQSRLPLILVSTRRDQAKAPDKALEMLCAEGRRLGFDTGAIKVASFSRNAQVEPGHGIEGLIRSTTAHEHEKIAVWPKDGGTTLFEPPVIRLVRKRTVK